MAAHQCWISNSSESVRLEKSSLCLCHDLILTDSCDNIDQVRNSATTILDAWLFKNMFMAQNDVSIVRRVFPHCRAVSQKDMYNRGLTDWQICLMILTCWIPWWIIGWARTSCSTLTLPFTLLVWTSTTTWIGDNIATPMIKVSASLVIADHLDVTATIRICIIALAGRLAPRKDVLSIECGAVRLHTFVMGNRSPIPWQPIITTTSGQLDHCFWYRMDR